MADSAALKKTKTTTQLLNRSVHFHIKTEQPRLEKKKIRERRARKHTTTIFKADEVGSRSCS